MELDFRPGYGHFGNLILRAGCYVKAKNCADLVKLHIRMTLGKCPILAIDRRNNLIEFSQS